jgi:hypothetical protein
MENNKEIISRLKFIGKVKKGEKINVRFMYVQQDGILTCLSRTFFNIDNKSNTLRFLQATVSKSFDLINLYLNSEKKYEIDLCVNIALDLEESKHGLLNLRETYISDLKFGCDIDTLLQEIEAKLKSIRHLLPRDDEDEV